jgi:glycosyltransferase involved in cell wall biosynthesis
VKVSVVIPTYQRRASLERLLEALGRQTLRDFEVVVGVDGSTDGTVAMLEALRPSYALAWVEQPNAGRAAACNAGIRRAAGELVVILDDDMEPAPELLAAHARHHTAGARRCVVGAVPVAAGPETPPHVRYVAAKFEEHLARLAAPGHAMTIRDFYSGNASVPRDDVVAAGLFDEAFRVYGNEDLDLGRRLASAGVELVFAPDAIARQHYEKDLAGLVRDERAKGSTAVLLDRRHPDARAGTRRASLARQARPVRAVRSALVTATHAWPRVPDVVLAGVRVAGRLPPRLRDRVYRFAFDYYFALGVEEAR